jgi:hypothetical protein
LFMPDLSSDKIACQTAEKQAFFEEKSGAVSIGRGYHWPGRFL